MPKSTVRSVTRRRFLTLASASVTLGATNACAVRRVVPSERAVSFGFENIVTDTPRWEHYAQQLRQVNATGLSLSVGRTDWTAFNWEARPQASADGVASSGRDYVAEAIHALRPELTGNSEITLTIDTLCPANIAADPSIAGVNPQGEASYDFPSVSSLESGIAGDLLVQLAGEICARYKPNRISLTELMFDDFTFGTPDLRSFSKHSGKKDWPRTSTGEIDTAHPSLGICRSAALANLLSRISTAAQAHGVLLDMDVRASWANPDGDRAASPVMPTKPCSPRRIDSSYGTTSPSMRVPQTMVVGWPGRCNKDFLDGSSCRQGFGRKTRRWHQNNLLPHYKLSRKLARLPSR